ncbi:undecaprenyl-phosphate glucose phosphotransferase [Tepidamorphus sp. 3E244]|uniref:undecaprenyl-phosphate glucose phosphotransferase n=1 Tax=Tepidamorphus sp. 3E244 TaxID=3385498 RepID=UPI0038FC9F7B
MSDSDNISRQILMSSVADTGSAGSRRRLRDKVELSPVVQRIAEAASSKRFSPILLIGAVRAIEIFAILVTAALSFAFYLHSADVAVTTYLTAVSVGTAIAAVSLQLVRIYSIPAFRAFMSSTARIVIVWISTFALLTAIAFVFKIGDDYSRGWVMLWFGMGLGALIGIRALLVPVVRHISDQHGLDRRAIIVGGGERGAQLIEALETSKESDIEICGIFDDRNDDRSPAKVAGYPKLGTVDELVEFCRHAAIDILIVTLPLTAESRVLDILKKLWVLPVDIRLSAHTNALRFRPRSYSYVGTVPMLDVFDKPLADWDAAVKNVFDRVVAALILIAASPVMLAVAAAVKLESKGPVFFKQKRYGFNNELIEVYKFRSMYTDRCDANAVKLVTKDDPRVTRVGKFIRKTSLDELPQLFNVLRGELSLVGPRPHAVQAKAAERLYDDVVDGYFARHKVKPGITGWAQVNGWRGETDTQEKIQRRVEHDLYYIENWSIWFDIYILAMTPVSLMDTRSAY